MQSQAFWDDHNHDLDIIGQTPFLFKLYTQVCFCFPVTDSSSYSSIINTLTTGLERLTTGFPWIAGGIVNEGSGEGNTGIFRIKPLEKIPRLVVKDLRHDRCIPTMEALRQAKFPFRMLDESTIAPCWTLPTNPHNSASDSAPVFQLQANFITGGLLLTFVGQHNAMDMVGQVHIIHLLSKACSNGQFTSEELSSGNLDRCNIIPSLDESSSPRSEPARQSSKPAPRRPSRLDSSSDPAPSPSSNCIWTYFSFSPSSLFALKSHATKTMNVPSGYISTDDAVSAFVWKSLTRARLPRLSPSVETTVARAVNVRRYLDIPPLYPGMVQHPTYHTYTLQKLVEEPLGVVASQFRSAIDLKTSTLGHDTRVLVRSLSRASDKTTVSFVRALDLSADFMLSSWANLECHEFDFNLGLGKAEAVRRPQFDPYESLAYLMPRTQEGEIALAICLREEDLTRLRADEEFAQYAAYIE